GISTPIFRHNPMIDEFLLNTLKISFRLIHFINGYNNRNICRLSVMYRFNCLWHHPIICSHYQYNYVSNFGSTSTHCCKRFMPWGIQESNYTTRSFNMISTYMLSDTTSFTSSDTRSTNIVQQ